MACAFCNKAICQKEDYKKLLLFFLEWILTSFVYEKMRRNVHENGGLVKFP
jgi:5-methylcytosine-specific restriction endonuclease McrBC regulatory subunit McrC